MTDCTHTQPAAFREKMELLAEIEHLKGALLWLLYQHQGGKSIVGEQIRAALGIGRFDQLTREQVVAAVSYAKKENRID